MIKVSFAFEKILDVSFGLVNKELTPGSVASTHFGSACVTLRISREECTTFRYLQCIAEVVLRQKVFSHHIPKH